jgi:LemA protein
MSMGLGRFLGTVLLALSLGGCGLQSIPQAKNKVDADFAEVTNQYKRRSDLIPTLVNVVKGYAKHEASTLEAVVEARSKATSVTIDASKVTPDQIKAFQEAQGGLSQALSRLLVASERYPELKADGQFRDLQAQLEGTENRITVARNRLIQTIREMNDLITVPPTSWTNSLIYHYEKLPQWTVAEDEKKAIEQAPKVEF